MSTDSTICDVIVTARPRSNFLQQSEQLRCTSVNHSNSHRFEFFYINIMKCRRLLSFLVVFVLKSISIYIFGNTHVTPTWYNSTTFINNFLTLYDKPQELWFVIQYFLMIAWWLGGDDITLITVNIWPRRAFVNSKHITRKQLATYHS